MATVKAQSRVSRKVLYTDRLFRMATEPICHKCISCGNIHEDQICTEPTYFLQWRSQDTADARAQHGHTTFVGISVQNEERTSEVWGNPPPEPFGIFELPRSVLMLFQALPSP